MHPMIRRLALLLLTWSFAAWLGGCDNDGGGVQDAGDTVAQTETDGGQEDDSHTAAGTFACGDVLTCSVGDQACAGRGQGACVGPAPDADGNCGPDCHAYECGGGQTCLCDTMWCVDLPSGCDDCDCATAPDASCMCDDSSGDVVFSCMGA